MDADGAIGRMIGVDRDGIRLHVVEAGPEDGPLAVLLHGFPEFWYGWHRQIGPLSEAGWRVMVPDQRGYNLSSKPKEVAAYGLDRLADDVLELAEAAGRRRFAVVGHDWGGIVAWWLAIRNPDRIDRVAILNAPHPATMARHLRRHPSQLARSWYVLFFQFPGLPERLLRAGGFRLARRALTTTSRPGTFDEEDLRRYTDAWSRPGAPTGMINWYRALRRRRAAPDARVRVPALLLWGGRDAFLDPGLADDAVALCEHGRLVRLDGASHWLHHEEPERVARELLGFLGQGQGSKS